MSRRPRWGIVGTGRISATTVGDLHLAENVDLFGDEDVDVVYVGTPISTHAELARRGIEAGKHVLVEKAFTTTAAEARELAALAAERSRFLMEAMWMVFNPAIRRRLAARR